MSAASSISAPCFSFAQRTSKAFLPRAAAAAAVSSPTSFIRTKTDLASSAQKSIDAGTYKTASDLAAKRPSVNKPPHSQPPSNPAGQPPPLDWNTFFKLRMRRRRIQVFFSIISGAGGLFAGAGVLSTGLAEPLVSQVPLDPIFTLGGLTIVFAAAGWLVGPSIGGQVFSMLNRGLMPQIRSKEGEFLTRIKKNRVDPSNSSAANPGLSISEYHYG
jgi:mitochondrial import inner membrane translocase subunit TIM23